MGRLIIDIACNGRTCDDCHVLVNPEYDHTCMCYLFNEDLQYNGDDEPLRCNACMDAESNVPDRVLRDYKTD
jgi:hypothetical protein